LVFIEETNPAQKVWTTPLSKLLLKIKDAAGEAQVEGESQLGQSDQRDWLRRYDRLVKKAIKLNPPVPRRKREPGTPKKKRIVQPTARGIVERLQRRRHEVLRFMTDLSVPFDNNGSERDLRMIKLQQKNIRLLQNCGWREELLSCQELSFDRSQAGLFASLLSRTCF
jgi:transposase